MKKSNGWTIFWLIVLFPFGLYRMWRYKQFPMVARIIVTAVLGLLFISSFSNNDSTETQPATASVAEEKPEETKKEEAPKKEEPTEKIYQVNEPVKTKKAEVTLKVVEEKSSVGGEYMKKDVSTGGTFVAIQYTLKNISDKPIGPFSFPSVQLIDEKGTKYDADIDASGNYAVETNVDNSKILSDLNPDIEVTNTKVFEISKQKYDAGKWFLLVDGKYKVAIK